jgi:hypothetical protein
MVTGQGHARTLASHTGNAHMTLSLINTVLTFVGHTIGTLGAKW